MNRAAMRVAFQKIKNHYDNTMPENAGRQFFLGLMDYYETKDFLSAFLTNNDYEGLATAMRFGFVKEAFESIKNTSNATYKDCSPLDAGYFNLFLGLCEKAKIKKEEIFSVCLCAIYAEPNACLYKWRAAAENHFIRAAFEDYDFVFGFLSQFDTKFLAFSSLMVADADRTKDRLLDILIFEKNIDKVALRKTLLKYKVDISFLFGKDYYDNETKTREAIVRLALVFKNEPESAMFLERVKRNDPAGYIRELVESQDDIQNKRIKPLNALEELEYKLRTGELIEATQFLERLKEDNAFRTICNQIFFAIHKEGKIADIAMVHGACLYDLDNIIIRLKPNSFIGVLHPIEIPRSFEDLKNRKIVDQPILQFSRPCFTPSDYEYASSEIRRFQNTLLLSKNLKSNIKKLGFSFAIGLKSDYLEYAVLTIGDYAVVAKFSSTDFSDDDELIMIKEAVFYRSSSLIPIAKRLYLEGVPRIRINEVPAKIFSEAVLALGCLCGRI